jgi:ribosome-associated protein
VKPEKMLAVGKGLKVPMREFQFSFSRASGPGGQNVNKVNSRVELRFDLLGSPTLSENQIARARNALGSRLTRQGEIIITCGRFRSQKQNQEACLERFRVLLQNALARRKRRIPTHPTGPSKEKRLRGKKERSEKKKRRGKVHPDD